MLHHTRVIIHPHAFRNNLLTLIQRYASDCRICIVVKADAYGHGIKKIAPIAADCGVDYLGIADNWEAAAIREMGISCRIIRLRPATFEEMIEAYEWEVEEILGDMLSAQQFSEWGLKTATPVPVHLKLDVGIGRMGYSWTDQKEEVLQAVQSPGLRLRGVMTHFPCADSDDFSLTMEQMHRFQVYVQELESFLPSDVVQHVANSAACIRMLGQANIMVRLGIAAYGLQPGDTPGVYPLLEPVMSWHTKVVQVRRVGKGSTIGYGMTYKTDRDAWIAALPVGYADGYPWSLSNRADVLIQGVRCPVVGRISMNMITVDVSSLPNVQPGDDVVLMGKQGGEEIRADELAKRAGTLNYTIPCVVGKSNPLHILDEKPTALEANES